jgi:iron-sulfur cluster repair protein YtfE (RIC family)
MFKHSAARYCGGGPSALWKSAVQQTTAVIQSPRRQSQKVPEEPKPEPIPDDIPMNELADMVVRGKIKLSPAQMRILIEMQPTALG